MEVLRSHLAHLGLAIVVVTAGAARAEAQAAKHDPARHRDGPLARLIHLLPPAFADDLELTADQQTKIQQLDQEFKQKRQETLVATGMKVMNIITSCAKGAEDAEPAPVLAVAHEVTGGLLAMRRSRFGYEKKMTALFNDEQKATFVALKEGPRERQRVRGGDGPDGHAFVSARLQERLRLTAEQQKQVSALHDEYHMKMRELLTAEQRTRFDEWWTSRPGRAINIREERPRQKDK